MNICFPFKTYLTPQSGINSFTDGIVRHLVLRGHQVHILTIDKVDETTHPSRNLYIHKIAYREPHFPGAWRIERILPLDNLSYSWKIARKLRKIVKQYSIDIIESSNWFETFFYSLRKRVPVVSRLHNSMAKLIKEGIFPNNMRTKTIAYLEGYQIKNSDEVISVSQNLCSFILQEYQLDKEINVIHNGIELENFYPVHDKESNAPIILFVGRLEVMKGIEFLGEAIPMVLRKFPEAEFVLIGQDMQHPDLKIKWSEYLKAKINSQRTLFLNKLSRNELLDFYHRCWMCVAPSLYDPFPITALEVMACAKPLIASRVGGLPELIVDRSTGILVTPRDPIALADAIIELIKNQNLRKQMGTNARKKAELEFNMEILTKKTIGVYENTIRKNEKIKPN